MSRKSELSQQVTAEHATLRGAAQTVQAVRGALFKELDAELAQTIKRAESKYATAIQQSNAELERVRQLALGDLQSALNRAGLSAAPWSAPGWNKHAPPSAASPAAFIRLGELQISHLATRLPPLPALIPLVGQKQVLLSFDDSEARLGASILEQLAWRVVASSSPESYHFILFDPLDRGTNLDTLLKLPESIRGPKIWCDDQDIERAMQEMDREIQDIIQRRLLNTYVDVEAYNLANPDVAIPYRLLIFIGFPKGLTVKAADLLLSIVRSGRRAGCYLLGSVVRGGNVPHGFDLASFTRQSTYLTLRHGNSLEWDDRDYAGFTVRPDAPPPVEVIDHLAQVIESLVAASSAATLSFRRLAVRKASWWSERSTTGLVVPIGIDENGGFYSFAIGQGQPNRAPAYHVLVGGATGMGKTNLLHLLILMLATKYHPDELELYLVDFKEGVEFQEYVTQRLVHARAVVLEAEREFGLSVLQRLVDEMQRRSQVFKAAGVSEIQEYRTRTGQSMPRILLIMDEYVRLFSDDDRLSFQASEALGALVMRGRSFGIHVLLSAQRPASTFLSMANIRGQMSLRIAFKCRPDDSTLILGEGNEKAARLARAGEACATADPDRVDATSQIRIARVEPDERTLYLRGLQEFARLKSYARATPMIVFSRNAPAIWNEGREIAQQLAGSPRKPLAQPLFWLGQPLRIADDISVSLESAQGSNVLILGNDEVLALRTLFSIALGLSLTTSPSAARFLLIGNLDPQQPAGRAFVGLQSRLPHEVQCVVRQAAVDTVSSLAVEMDQRLAQLPAAATRKVFVFVAGLHRWMEARGPNSYTPSSVGELLTRLCQHGSQVGIHILMWSDRVSSIGAAVGAAAVHDMVAQFGHRIAFQMSSDESFNFVGAPLAAKLGSERALYRNEQWPADILDKFKPYSWFGPADLQNVLDIISSGWGKP